MTSRGGGWVLAVAIQLAGAVAQAVPVTSRTPGIDSPATTAPRTVDFLFAHHFSLVVPKVFNSPTFTLETGLLDRLSLGLRYASSSDFGERVNDLEPLLKWRLLRQQSSGALDLTAIAAWSSAARSAEGALVAGRSLGPVTLLAEARGFSNGYAVAGWTAAAGAGLKVRLTQHLALVGDLNRVLGARRALPAQSRRYGWSGGVAFDIPYSPHSMSLYATNLNTHTMQGASRGSDRLRIGFEFLVPFTDIDRWVAIVFPPEPVAPARESGETGNEEQTAVAIESMAFSPARIEIRAGTSVRWTNRDPVPHTASADGRDWDSGPIAPGESFSRRFDVPGTWPYRCSFHPFMRGVVVVREDANK